MKKIKDICLECIHGGVCKNIDAGEKLQESVDNLDVQKPFDVSITCDHYNSGDMTTNPIYYNPLDPTYNPLASPYQPTIRANGGLSNVED